MTRLIISTSHRNVLHNEVSGWLHIIDLESRRILQSTAGIEPPYRVYDTNPRGGMRGLRGISIRNGEIAVTNYSSILFFDQHWNFLRAFTHPSVSSIHEILHVDDGIWVTSTANDMLAKFDLAGSLSEYYLVHEQNTLMTKLKMHPRYILRSVDIYNGKTDFRRRSYFNADAYDRTHLNSICAMPDGGLLLSLGLIVDQRFSFLMILKTIMLKLGVWNIFLSLNRLLRRMLKLEKHLHSELVAVPAKGRSAILRFDAPKQWDLVMQFSTMHNPSHSVRALRDGKCVYLDTSTGTIVHFDENGLFLSRTKIADSFLRGILELPNGQLVIGAENQLLFFDLKIQKIMDQVELSKTVESAVFDIQILPSEFALPPDSLEMKVGRMKDYQGQQIIWEQPAHAYSGSHP